MMNNKRNFLSFGAALMVLGLVSIVLYRVYLIWGDEARLEERVISYFEEEKKKNWGSAYYFRPSIFRKYISVKEYSGAMGADSNGWELVNYRVDEIDVGGDRAKVILTVVHSVPDDFQVPPGFSRDRMKFKVVTRWVREGRDWYVEDAGFRLHLSYNKMLVKE